MRAWRRRIGVVLVALATGVASCAPVIPESVFLEVASDWALGPERTCNELKIAFGMPNVTTVAHPGELGLDYHEEHIPLAEGGSLRAWYLPAADSRGLVVLSNGAVGEMACYLFITLNLLERGWSVAMYDFSGFGGSSGEASLTTLVSDGRAGVDWARQVSGEGRVILWGVSLGTIPVADYAAAYPERVEALVLDGPISLRAEIESFAFVLAWQPERYLRLFEPSAQLEETLPRVTSPLLAYTYGQDEFATARRAPAILAMSSGPVVACTFNELRHARGPYLATETYFEVLEAFLTDVTRR